MEKSNLLGIAGGGLLGYAAAKFISKGTVGGGGMPADIETWAQKISAFDTLIQVFLVRKPLYSYTHGGFKAGLYAFTITDDMGGSIENDNPQIVMSVTPMNGGCRYEFGGHGQVTDIYYGSEFTPRLSVPKSQTFDA
jgi:hypothetical protein